MTISWISSSLSVLGPRSRSQWLFLEKNVIALVPSFIIQFQYNFTQVLGMTIPQAFQHDRVKVKVAVTVFRKTAIESLSGFKGKILLVHLFL